MKAYVFGFYQYVQQTSLASSFASLESATSTEVASELIAAPGAHVLPLLSGDPDDLVVVRTRQLELLKLALTEDHLRSWIQLELDHLSDNSGPVSPHIEFSGASWDWLPDWWWESWDEFWDDLNPFGDPYDDWVEDMPPIEINDEICFDGECWTPEPVPPCECPEDLGDPVT